VWGANTRIGTLPAETRAPIKETTGTSYRGRRSGGRVCLMDVPLRTVVGTIAPPISFALVSAVFGEMHRTPHARVLVSPRPEPGDASPPADLRHEIEDMLHSLPSDQRDALVLVEWLELSSEEAGSVLGISLASVRGRIHRARTSLRNRLGEDDD
jgi:predicted DNA-binding protein (UPF0251 family)